MSHKRDQYPWSYSQKDLLDEVKENLPEDYSLLVYKVTSGDTGKEYWVQLMYHASKPGGFHNQIFAMCNCNQGTFRLPLTVLGMKDFFCKHVTNLLEFIEEQK